MNRESSTEFGKTERNSQIMVSSGINIIVVLDCTPASWWLCWCLDDSALWLDLDNWNYASWESWCTTAGAAAASESTGSTSSANNVHVFHILMNVSAVISVVFSIISATVFTIVLWMISSLRRKWKRSRQYVKGKWKGKSEWGSRQLRAFGALTFRLRRVLARMRCIVGMGGIGSGLQLQPLQSALTQHTKSSPFSFLSHHSIASKVEKGISIHSVSLPFIYWGSLRATVFNVVVRNQYSVKQPTRKISPLTL